MEKTSVYSYYVFGYNYNFLRNITKNTNKAECIKLLKEHLSTLQELNLAVSLNIIRFPIEEIIETLENSEDEKTTEDKIKEIGKLLEKADAALDSELSLKMILSVTQKRFDTESLLNSPEKLLADSVWDKMSYQSKVDFIEGTKCIAMNLPTASAFHLMRALEQRLKDLYFFYVKSKRLSKPMWGPMVTKLKDKNNPKPTKETLDTLDIIRVNYRNPTQHPQKNYTIDEAQDLLNHTIVAINSIHRDMRIN